MGAYDLLRKRSLNLKQPRACSLSNSRQIFPVLNICSVQMRNERHEKMKDKRFNRKESWNHILGNCMFSSRTSIDKQKLKSSMLDFYCNHPLLHSIFHFLFNRLWIMRLTQWSKTWFGYLDRRPEIWRDDGTIEIIQRQLELFHVSNYILEAHLHHQNSKNITYHFI